MSKDIEVEVEVRAVTIMALQVYNGNTTAWITKSQISDYAGSEAMDQKVTGIFIPEWLAIEKGLV